MVNGKDGPLASLAFIISVFTFIVTGIGVYLSYSQVKDLREQFDWSGAVLSVEISVQLKYNDGRREPVNLSEQQHPTLTGRDFDTSDAIYLVYKVQNTGRLETTLTGAELRIGQDVTIKADDSHVRSLCAAQGGGAVDCRQAFAVVPPKLEPGWTYYFYFPLKDIRDKLKVGTGLYGEISATGLRDRSIRFPLGISVNLQ